MNWRRWRLDAIAFAAGLLLLWHLLAEQKIISPIFFPSPRRTLGQLYERFADGSIWLPLSQTTLRMIYGWLLACVLGVLLGSLIGSFKTARAYLDPLLEFVRPLPASAMIPVAILATGGLSHDLATPRMGLVNESFDRELLRLIEAGDCDTAVAHATAHVHKAGNGAEEVRMWLAAMGAAGGGAFHTRYYRAVSAWYTGIGIGDWQA